MQRFKVYYFAVFCLILLGSLFSISARRQVIPSYTIYDKGRAFYEMLPVGENKHVASMAFDNVWNEGFFPRVGDVFQRSDPVFVNVSGVCTVKNSVYWDGVIVTDSGSAVMFSTTDKAAVFNRSFYASSIDFVIKQYGTVPVGVGCHVTFQEIK